MPTAQGTARARQAWDTRRAKSKLSPRPKSDELPPNSFEDEQAALSCVLQFGDRGSQQNVEATLVQLRPTFFYDHRLKTLHHELVQMTMANVKLDFITLLSWLRDQKSKDQLFNRLEECGGESFLRKTLEAAPTPINFNYYLPKLKECALRRWCLGKTGRLKELAEMTDLSPEQLREEFAEIYEQSVNIGATTQPLIRIVSPAQARAFEADPSDFLVGQGLVSRGMIVTIAGDAGIGKSRLATTLAIAGARGNNRWMNYPIRTKFRTLVLQSENDAHRLKEDCSVIPDNFNDDIRFSDGLSHGLAFDRPEFRRELRRFFEDWPFELMVVDPWNDVTSEDGQKDYKQALLNISACFRGAKMPAVVIVAHLRKRGRDESAKRKSGRELLGEISGSLALGSTSRTVFAVMPVESSMEDPRIVFEIVKANNCHPDWLREHGTRTAWVRANGAFESVKGFDWGEYDNPGDPERRKVTEDMIKTVFDGEKELKPAHLATKLHKVFGVGQSTAFRAVGEDGYLRNMMQRTATGKLQLKTNGL
jgi:DnaB-like helicase N terminal domain/AAA domain